MAVKGARIAMATAAPGPASNDVEALRSIVEGTARATGDDFFRTLVKHLAVAMQARDAFVGEAPVSTGAPEVPRESVDLSEVQRDHILGVLRKTDWVIEGNRGAAKRLGMKPGTLRHRMKKLGISRGAPAAAEAATFHPSANRGLPTARDD